MQKPKCQRCIQSRFGCQWKDQRRKIKESAKASEGSSSGGMSAKPGDNIPIDLMAGDDGELENALGIDPVDGKHAASGPNAEDYLIGNMDSRELKTLLQAEDPQHLLIFDTRPRSTYLQASIEGAVNFDLSSWLIEFTQFESWTLEYLMEELKDRGYYNLERKIQSFQSARNIVVYGERACRAEDERQYKEAQWHFLNVFCKKGWLGSGYILKDTFQTFSTLFPDVVVCLEPGTSTLDQEPSGMHSDAESFTVTAGSMVSRIPHRKKHLVKGALGRDGVASVIANHQIKGNEPLHRGRNIVGDAALGAIGAEALTRI
jgi:hypothetical protein